MWKYCISYEIWFSGIVTTLITIHMTGIKAKTTKTLLEQINKKEYILFIIILWTINFRGNTRIWSCPRIIIKLSIICAQVNICRGWDSCYCNIRVSFARKIWKSCLSRTYNLLGICKRFSNSNAFYWFNALRFNEFLSLRTSGAVRKSSGFNSQCTLHIFLSSNSINTNNFSFLRLIAKRCIITG